MTNHGTPSPNPAASDGRSAIIRPFGGQAALQPASGAPPETTGEKKNHGMNATAT
jgi:hypothetical protein